ncbi:hypothetical protein [Streptomyces sp. SAS_270]|uniref:hypothetical protein n=1 Tax=Streptomyces sp. SAS_270 TaxID=3412748 RepID=UPI00403C509C
MGTGNGTDVAMSGVDYPHSVIIFCVGGRANDYQYNLGATGKRLLGQVGIGDSEDASGLPANVSFYGDDRLIKTVKVSLGKPAPINLDIRGVIRLRIAATLIQGVYDGRNISVSVGDARFTS